MAYTLRHYAESVVNDRFFHWHLLGRFDTNEHLVMDLNPARLGRIYFVELYFLGQPGRNPILAPSLSRFLTFLRNNLESNHVREWRDFGKLGDAYD